MSSPYLHYLSSPTANCPVRINNSPGDAESPAVPPAAAEQEELTQAATPAEQSPCWRAVWPQNTFVSVFPTLSTVLAPKADGRVTKDNYNTQSLSHIFTTPSSTEMQQHTHCHVPHNSSSLCQCCRTAPTQDSITHHTYISLHMWQHPTSCKLNMPAKLPLHTDCSSGQETESSGLLRKFVDKWIWILVLLKLIYFKHKPL